MFCVGGELAIMGRLFCPPANLNGSDITALPLPLISPSGAVGSMRYLTTAICAGELLM
jgi:hypothetical protein